jgi:uncharacterized protein
MSAADFRRAIVDYVRANAKPPDKFSHQPRLYHLAAELAREESRTFDDDILFAAAWLHDIGVFIGHRPEDPATLAKWDNVAYAVKESPRLLGEFGFPTEKISAVAEVIQTHLPSSNPTSFEGVLLRDADILEQLGAVAILRIVSKVGRDTRFITFGDAVRVLQRNMEVLPAQLKLDSARRAAKARVKILADFLRAAKSETSAIDW